MIAGMPPLLFVHVVISLVGIGSGFIVLFAMIAGKYSKNWTLFFLVTTILTSLTGFILPAHKFMPSHALGIMSLIALGMPATRCTQRRPRVAGAPRLPSRPSLRSTSTCSCW